MRFLGRFHHGSQDVDGGYDVPDKIWRTPRCKMGLKNRVNEEDVEEAREAKFAVGNVEGVGTVFGVPSDEGAEEVGVQEFGIDPSHVDGAGD